jgi:hypothetical protein
MPVFLSLEQKAVDFLGIRLQSEQRAKALVPKLLAEGLLRYDGVAFALDDTNRKLLPHAPELLNKEKLRAMHDAGNRLAWGTLCDVIREELKEVSHQNERHLIPELNHASPLRLERNPIAKQSIAPAVRDENFWKNLEKKLEAAIVGGK